jgi:hypothetical protein
MFVQPRLGTPAGLNVTDEITGDANVSAAGNDTEQDQVFAASLLSHKYIVYIMVLF